MLKHLLPAVRITLALTILTGFVYPGIVTLLSQTLFPAQAAGSMIFVNGRAAGSILVGQRFTRAEYFHTRPSAAGGGYDAASSGGSNLGPTSRKLFDRVKASAEQFRMRNPGFDGAIPADALTTSSSGLDPHISPANAHAQIERVAAARRIDPEQIRQMVARLTAPRTFGILGEPRVHVLQLNIALDEQFPRPR